MDRQALSSIGRVIGHANSGKWRFYTGVVFRVLERSVAIAPLLLCFHWLQQQLLTTPKMMPWLSTPVDYLMALGGCFVVQLVCAYIGQYQSFVGSYQVVHAYRIKLINHVRQLPLGRVRRTHSSEFLEMLTEDIKKIESIFSHIAPDLIERLLKPNTSPAGCTDVLNRVCHLADPLTRAYLYADLLIHVDRTAPMAILSANTICDCEKRNADFAHVLPREIAPIGVLHRTARFHPLLCALAHHLLTQRTCAPSAPTAWRVGLLPLVLA